jgi:hypothetical protein
MPPLPPILEILEILLRDALPAFVAAGVVLLAVGRLLPARLSPAAGALALAAGFAASLYFAEDVQRKMIREGPQTPTEMLQGLQAHLSWQSTDTASTESVRPPAPLVWFPWALALVLLAGMLGDLPSVVGTWVLRLVVVLVAAVLLVDPETRTQVPWVLPAFVVAALAEWWVLDDLARERPGGWQPLGLFLCFLTSTGVILLAHSALVAEVALILTAATAGIALAAWRYQTDTSGLAAGAAVALPGILLIGQQSTFSEVPIPTFLLVGLAPLVLVVLLPLKRRLSGQRLALVGRLLFLIPLVAAVVLLVRSGVLTSG